MPLKKLTPRVTPLDTRSLWQNRYKNLWCFICPLCQAPRRVPFRPSPGVKAFLQIGLTTFFFTLICWRWFTWKGCVSFIPFWTVFELIYRARLRVALPCDQCGFDPYLFAIDARWASREVDAHWRKKFAEKGIPYPEPPPTAVHPRHLRQGNPPPPLPG